MWRKPVIGIGNRPTAAVQPLPASERVPVFPQPPLQSAAGRCESGASAVEFAIAAPALLLALLGTFQAALLYQARAQLEVATQEAVRAGALHGASVGAMRTALARGLTPLYTHGRDLGALAKGHAAAQVAAGQADIRILNPTREAFADFAEQTRDTSGAWVRAIPNDHLGYRRTSPGTQSQLSIQDANLLKIQVTYTHPLVMPFIDQIGRGLYKIQQGLSGTLGIPSFFGLTLKPIVGLDGQVRWGIPLQAEALMRMQSPVLATNLPSQKDLAQRETAPTQEDGTTKDDSFPDNAAEPNQLHGGNAGGDSTSPTLPDYGNGSPEPPGTEDHICG